MENQSTGRERIRGSRERMNVLKEAEFNTIEFFCERMPKWVFPDLLTAIGFFGSIIIFVGLILAIENKYFLLLSVFGFAVQWFGDSLDGRLAYYRNTPRKWYGWALDINVDWISACIIGLGYYFYFPEYKIISFIFVIAYGGSMIVALQRYKITNKYIIDNMSMGPTELRIIVSIAMIFEMFFNNSLLLLGVVGSLIIISMNVVESLKVFKEGDLRDKRERIEKARLNPL